MPHILVVAFLGPTIGVFFDGAVFGAIPLLVGRGRIAEANSYAWSLQSAIEIVAPARGRGDAGGRRSPPGSSGSTR